MNNFEEWWDNFLDEETPANATLKTMAKADYAAGLERAAVIAEDRTLTNFDEDDDGIDYYRIIDEIAAAIREEIK